MATATWTCNKDAITADNGTSMGAGAGDYLPVGNYSGFDYRAFLGFAYSFAGMVTITNAVLHAKTSSQSMVAFSASPDILIRRLASSWSEGTATSPSSTNAIERSNEPVATGTTPAAFHVTTSENTWATFDITIIVQEAFAAGVFYGIRLGQAAAGNITEFYAREYGSNDAYIVVTYTTNVVPTAPTLNSPISGAIVTTQTPTLNFTPHDPDADTHIAYEYQVSTNSGFTGVVDSGIISGSFPNGVAVNRVVPTTLSRGTTYYWRVRTSDTASGYGPFSTTGSFKVAQLPVTTLTMPSVADSLIKLAFTAGSGWASPRPVVTWTFSCPDGGTQASYQVIITQCATSGGTYTAFYDSGTVSGTALTVTAAATLTEGYYYKVKVRATCSHGQVATYTAEVRTRARWGVALHRFDCTAAPSTWSISTLSTTTISTNAVAVEYASNTTTSTPATFYASLGSVALNRYFFYRVYLLAWGASPATSPTLNALTLTYSANVLVADKWTRSDTAHEAIDQSTYVYGTQSLKLTATGSDHAASQLVGVLPDTDYVLSGRVKVVGSPSPVMAISAGPVVGALVSCAIPNVDTDWARYSVKWNSGANTSVYIVCRSSAAGTPGATVNFDALKLEASAVVTPWTPGFLGSAVVLDAGGLQIDTSVGGIFRVQSTDANAVLKMTNGGVMIDSQGTDQYGVLAFADQGAKRVYLDYGTGATDDFRVLMATGAAGAEVAVEALRIRAADNFTVIPTDKFSAPTTRTINLPLTEGLLDAATLITVGASPQLSRAINFADAATQGVSWVFTFPSDAVAGSFVLKLRWSPSATDAVAHTARWNVLFKTLPAAVDMTGAASNTLAWTGTSSAHNINIAYLDTSANMSPTTIIVAPDTAIRMVLQRLGADAADTFVGSARLYAATISYSASR